MRSHAVHYSDQGYLLSHTRPGTLLPSCNNSHCLTYFFVYKLPSSLPPSLPLSLFISFLPWTLFLREGLPHFWGFRSRPPYLCTSFKQPLVPESSKDYKLHLNLVECFVVQTCHIQQSRRSHCRKVQNWDFSHHHGRPGQLIVQSQGFHKFF